MSKFEILQNNKINQEWEQYEKLVSQTLIIERKIRLWEFFAFNTPGLITETFKTALLAVACYTIWNGTNTLAEFV